MKKNLKMFVTCGVLFAAMPLMAETWTDSYTGYTWTYRINGDTAEICGTYKYLGEWVYTPCVSPNPTGAMTIPTTLGGYTVTRIGNYAFYNCSGLTSVTMPDSVTSIRQDAFHDCSALTSVTIPDGVTSIGDRALEGCSGLTNVVMHNSVTYIGDSVFSGCSRLTHITIPDSVTSIGSGAFSCCTNLNSITIVDTTRTFISEDAFNGCSGLETIRIENGRIPLPSCLFTSGARRIEVPAALAGYVRNQTDAEIVGIEGCTPFNMGAIYGFLSASAIRADGSLQINVSFGEFALDKSVTTVSVYMTTQGGSESTTNFTFDTAIKSNSILSVVFPDTYVSGNDWLWMAVSNSLFVGTIGQWVSIPEESDVVVDFGNRDLGWGYCGPRYTEDYLYATSTSGVIRINYAKDIGGTSQDSAYEIGQPGELELCTTCDYDWQAMQTHNNYATYYLPEGAPGVLYASLPEVEYDENDIGNYVDPWGYVGSEALARMLRMAQNYPLGYYHTWFDSRGEYESFSAWTTYGLYVPPYIKTHEVGFSMDDHLFVTRIGGYSGDEYIVADDGDYWGAELFENPLEYHYGDYERNIELPSRYFIDGSVPLSVVVNAGYYIAQISNGDKYIKYDQNGNVIETSPRQWYYDPAMGYGYFLPVFDPVTNDVTYSFSSAPIAYNITFVDELGAANPNATTYTVEDYYDFQPPAAVDGWDFLGWDVSGVCYQTGDITVTAQWSQSDRTVTFDVGAHGTRTGGGALTQTVVWGSAAESPTITADLGWVFTGWDADISYVTDTITVTAQYERAPLSIDAASGLDKVWTVGGNVPWYTEWSDDAHDGLNHLHSGAIGDNQESWIETIVTNTGVVSFWWKASSEEYRGVAYDKVVFSVDDVVVASIGGEVDWTNVTYAVEGNGPHVLRWTYCKDASDHGGQDCAWLDEVQYLREVRVAFADGGAPEGSVPATETIGEGLQITLPNQGSLAWPKHRFMGWGIDHEILAAGTPYVLGYDDVTFTAVWEEKRVSAPTIEVAAWYDTERTAVTMECGTAGAAIHYTLDGSTPTSASPVYAGSFYLAGSATIKAIAVLDDFFDSDVVSAESVRAPWTPDECLNAPGLAFNMGGGAIWVRDRTVTHDDDTAMRSGTIGNNQNSWIETSVSGAGTLTFWWKVSSEAYKGTIYDYARFTVDGVAAVPDIGGEIGWRNETVTITGGGTHTLRWAYVKDAQDMNGSDCAWLDEVTWTPAEAFPAIVDSSEVAMALAGAVDEESLAAHITTKSEYDTFRSWVDGKGLAHAVVRDAPNAWLSYALDAPGLMAKVATLANEDVVIESVEPSSAADGALVLVVNIADEEIGEGVTSARLAEVLGVEGATELNESAFSSEGLSVTLERTADGKAKATVAPDGTPSAFFMRVKVR